MTEAFTPCWAIKKCTVRGCVAYGKSVNCFGMPNAGYARRFCDGPMCKRLKNMVCPGCEVSRQWRLNELIPERTDEEIAAAINSGRLIVERPVSEPIDNDKSE
jgi:hypothetical protein